MAIQTTSEGRKKTQYTLIAALIGVAFFTSYAYANAKSGGTQNAFNSYAAQAGNGAAGAYDTSGGGGAGGGAGGGCCGGGGPAVEGSTKVAGDVQKIDVDTSSGSFAPNVIKAKAGVPLEISFSQSGGGCLSGVFFPDFNINEDLTAGAKTVKIPALQKGEYTFYCQMQMVSAKIVVE